MNAPKYPGYKPPDYFADPDDSIVLTPDDSIDGFLGAGAYALEKLAAAGSWFFGWGNETEDASNSGPTSVPGGVPEDGIHDQPAGLDLLESYPPRPKSGKRVHWEDEPERPDERPWKDHGFDGDRDSRGDGYGLRSSDEPATHGSSSGSLRHHSQDFPPPPPVDPPDRPRGHIDASPGAEGGSDALPGRAESGLTSAGDNHLPQWAEDAARWQELADYHGTRANDYADQAVKAADRARLDPSNAEIHRAEAEQLRGFADQQTQLQRQAHEQTYRALEHDPELTQIKGGIDEQAHFVAENERLAEEQEQLAARARIAGDYTRANDHVGQSVQYRVQADQHWDEEASLRDEMYRRLSAPPPPGETGGGTPPPPGGDPPSGPEHAVADSLQSNSVYGQQPISASYAAVPGEVSATDLERSGDSFQSSVSSDSFKSFASSDSFQSALSRQDAPSFFNNLDSDSISGESYSRGDSLAPGFEQKKYSAATQNVSLESVADEFSRPGLKHLDHTAVTAPFSPESGMEHSVGLPPPGVIVNQYGEPIGTIEAEGASYSAEPLSGQVMPDVRRREMQKHQQLATEYQSEMQKHQLQEQEHQQLAEQYEKMDAEYQQLKRKIRFHDRQVRKIGQQLRANRSSAQFIDQGIAIPGLGTGKIWFAQLLAEPFKHWENANARSIQWHREQARKLRSQLA